MILLGLIISFAGEVLVVRQRYDPDARRTVVRRAVAESLGVCTLALSCDDVYTRNPLEGPAACLGDVPGGYCWHAACDLVACPGPIGQPFTLNLVSAAQ